MEPGGLPRPSWLGSSASPRESCVNRKLTAQALMCLW